MKITEKELNEFVALLSEAEQFRPIVNLVLDTVESYGSEMTRVIDGLIDYSVKRNKKTFDRYLAAGFTRSEAMQLILTSHIALKDALDKSNKKGK